jgi:hypothetical protein
VHDQVSSLPNKEASGGIPAGAEHKFTITPTATPEL